MVYMDITIVLVGSLKKYKPCYSVVYISNVNTARNLVYNMNISMLFGSVIMG